MHQAKIVAKGFLWMKNCANKSTSLRKIKEFVMSGYDKIKEGEDMQSYISQGSRRKWMNHSLFN